MKMKEEKKSPKHEFFKHLEKFDANIEIIEKKFKKKKGNLSKHEKKIIDTETQ